MEDRCLNCRLEPLGIEQLWRRLTMGNSYSPKVWNNCYLAAFALADSLTLVTFDKGVVALPDLDLGILSDG